MSKYLSETRAQELINEVKNRLNGKVSLSGATMTGTLEAPVLRAGTLAEGDTNNLFEIGNGIHDNDTGVDTKKNVFAVDKDGNVVITGDLTDGNGNTLSDVVKNSTVAYKPKGTKEFDDLPTPTSDKEGWVFNVINTITEGLETKQTYFAIDDRFIDYDADTIKTYPSGTNIVVIESVPADDTDPDNIIPAVYKYDVLPGFIDLSNVGGTVDEITAAELATMWKDDGILVLDKNTIVLTSAGDTSDVTVTAATGSITAESSDTDVATVSVDTTGTDPVVTITAVAAGSATVTITSAESSGYKAIVEEVSVTCSF